VRAADWDARVHAAVTGCDLKHISVLAPRRLP
jgi:hypothetical protein